MNVYKYIIFCFILFLVPYRIQAKKWYVNDASTAGDIYCSSTGKSLPTGIGLSGNPFLKLQDAVAAVGDGDTIYVDAGTYLDAFSISIKKNNIKIIGAGKKATIFDGSAFLAKTMFEAIGTYSTVPLNSNVVNFYLEGVHIKNYKMAGAMTIRANSRIDSTVVSISRCFFENNTSSLPHSVGGGVISAATDNGLPVVLLIDFCDFLNNHCTYGTSGGSINFKSDKGRLSVIKSNFFGCADKDLDILSNTDEAGAIDIYKASKVYIESCFFRDFVVDGNGGAIVSNCPVGSIIIDKSVFYNNKSEDGSALYIQDGLATIYNSLFVKNNCDAGTERGGVITSGYSSSVVNIYNSTITENTCINSFSPTYSGVGGILMSSAGKIKLYNSIAWKNGVDVYGNGCSGCNQTLITLHNSIIEKTAVKSLYKPKIDSVNLLHLDPMFENVAINDFRIKTASPAINLGLSASRLYDITGASRPGISDAGAFELGSSSLLIPQICGANLPVQGPGYYVNASKSSGDVFCTEAGKDVAGYGVSRAAPAKTISWLLSSSGYSFNPGDTIYVDEDTYSDQNVAITKKGIIIVGAGKNTDGSYKTVFESSSSSSCMVISTSDVVLSDFKIQGYKNKGINVLGGSISGIKVLDVQVNTCGNLMEPAVLVNQGSSVLFKGGGTTCAAKQVINTPGYSHAFEIYGGAGGNKSYVDIENYVISGTTAGNGAQVALGGAIYMENSNLNMKNSIVEDNQSWGPGSALYVKSPLSQSSITISNCKIQKNSTRSNPNNSDDINSVGGAIALLENSKMRVSNTLFELNTLSGSASSPFNGGAIGVSASELTVDSCYFQNNLGGNNSPANRYGNDIYVFSGSAKVFKSTFNAYDGALYDYMHDVLSNGPNGWTGIPAQTNNTTAGSPDDLSLGCSNSGTLNVDSSGNPSKSSVRANINTNNTVNANYSPSPITPSVSGSCPNLIIGCFASITGDFSICLNDSTQLTASGIPDAISPWSSTDTNVVKINALGYAKAVSQGTSMITYKDSKGCRATELATVNLLPIISGTDTFCQGTSLNLIGSGTPDATSPWNTSDGNVAQVDFSGKISGILPGNATITYTDNNACYVKKTITIKPAPATPVLVSLSDTNQVFCKINNTLLSDLKPKGDSILWYYDSTGTNALSKNLILKDTVYYASQISGGCESVSRLKITVNIKDTVPPLPETIGKLCKTEKLTLDTLFSVFKGDSLKFYNVPNAGVPLLVTDSLKSGDYYVTQANPINGCESSTRLKFTITIDDTLAPSLIDPLNDKIVVCKIVYAKADTLSSLVNEKNILWYLDSVGGNPISTGDTLKSATYFAAQQMQGACESSVRLSVKVIVKDTLAPQIDDDTLRFCKIEKLTIADITVQGNNVKWYDAAVGGNELKPELLLDSGKTYYATQEWLGCEGANRDSIHVIIFDTDKPTLKDPANSQITFCALSNALVDTLKDFINETFLMFYDSLGNVLNESDTLLAGTYFISNHPEGKCESSELLKISINIKDTVPPIFADDTLTFCAIDKPSVDDLYKDLNNVTWYSSLSDKNPIVKGTPLDSNTFYYGAQNSFGCQSSKRDSVFVIIKNPKAPVSANNLIFCASQTPKVSDLTPSGSAIKWYNFKGELLSGNEDLVNDSSYYAAELVAGCESENRLKVKVIVEDPQLPVISSKSKLTVCKGETASIEIENPIAGYIYNIYSTNESVIPIGTAPFTFVPDNDTIYYVEVKTNNGCKASKPREPIPVKVFERPVIPSVFGDSVKVCENDTIELQVLNSQSNLIYTWTGPNNYMVLGDKVLITLSADSTLSGTYYVFAKDKNTNCSTLKSDSVEVEVKNVKAGFFSNTTLGFVPYSIEFTNTSFNAINYLWNFNDGATSTEVSPKHLFEKEGSFSVYLIAYNGLCNDTSYGAQIDIEKRSKLEVPNVFSPNKDNYNDVFNVIGDGLKTINGSIFNRWGQLIYEWDSLKRGWDGNTMAGFESPEGTYFYTIKATGKDGVPYFFQGNVLLVR